MSEKRSVSELLRLACVYAEQDRYGYSLCDAGEDGKEAAKLAKELRFYREKRWGESKYDKTLREADTINIYDILKSKP